MSTNQEAGTALAQQFGQAGAKFWTVCDKTTWGDGPWQSEPDKVQWVDEATGLDCLIVRGYYGGALCGYVGIPPGHEHHGKHYDYVGVEVHGGLTFSDSCQESEHGEGHGVCHVAGPGRPADVWWLGFDCAHYLDVSPGSRYKQLELAEAEYRDVAYVKNQCRELAGQLAATVQS